MRTKLIVALIAYFLCLGLPALAQDENGFTNKAEAKNESDDEDDGLTRDGKWILYGNGSGKTVAPENATYYILIIYHHGEKYGTARKYYMSGRLEEEMHYVKNKLSGDDKEYYENGNLESVMHFTEDGQNDKISMYYVDGKLKSEVSITDGKMNGAAKMYYESGNIKLITNYNNGVQIGDARLYDDVTSTAETNATTAKKWFTNKNEATNQTINGLKEGKWIEYYDTLLNATTDVNAPLYRLVIYNDGNINGWVMWYYKNGKINCEIPYTNSKASGKATFYYQNGKICRESNYIDGKKDGDEKIYYPDGKLKEESRYSNGEAKSTLSYKDVSSGNTTTTESSTTTPKNYFTSSAEATNLYKNGQKDGKWKEYIDANFKTTTDVNAPYYCLVIYKAGKRDGWEMRYLKSGTIQAEFRYENGILTGTAQIFYPDGKTVEIETVYSNGKKNGLEKGYYSNGKIYSKTNYTNGIAGPTMYYNEDGTEKK